MVDLPFDAYPQKGRKLLGRVKGSNCRTGYGLQHMKITSQTRCAYCGLDFTASYENWVQMALDHVVPVSTGKAKGILDEWLDDSASKVLACSTCNSYDNRYKLPAEVVERPTSLDDYFDLRDKVFVSRKKNVAAQHEKGRVFFAAHVKPLWE